MDLEDERRGRIEVRGEPELDVVRLASEVEAVERDLVAVEAATVSFAQRQLVKTRPSRARPRNFEARSGPSRPNVAAERPSSVEWVATFTFPAATDSTVSVSRARRGRRRAASLACSGFTPTIEADAM